MPAVRPAMPPRSLERRLTVAYVVALAIVALLTIASHFVLTTVLKTQNGSAAVINMSGRQRMLSQRIASLAAQYALGDVSARASLQVAIDQFERAHEILVHGDHAHRISSADTPELRAIYFSGAVPLDGEIHRFIADARIVAAAPPGDTAVRPVLERLFAQAEWPLLQGLEDVVEVHQRESETVLAKLEDIQDATLLVVLMTLLLEALAIFRPLVRRVSHYARQLVALATVDPLTGVLNRRSFFERGALVLDQSRQEAGMVSALMIDADHFKRVNDTYGHAGGDAVLKALASTLRQECRGVDLIGRLGGEEFAVLLPGTDLGVALQAAERVLAGVSKLRVASADASISITVSIGGAILSEADDGLDSLLARADQALYLAKAKGRNRVEIGP